MSDSKVQAFSFGDPEPVLNNHDFSGYFETWLNGRYFEPHISLNGLAKSFRSTPYLSTAIIYKKISLFHLSNHTSCLAQQTLND